MVRRPRSPRRRAGSKARSMATASARRFTPRARSISPIRSFSSWAPTRARVRPATRPRRAGRPSSDMNGALLLVHPGPGSALQPGRRRQSSRRRHLDVLGAHQHLQGDAGRARPDALHAHHQPTAEFSLIAVDDPYGWSTTTAVLRFPPSHADGEREQGAEHPWTGSPTVDVIAQLRASCPAPPSCTSSAIRPTRSPPTWRPRPATSCSA